MRRKKIKVYLFLVRACCPARKNKARLGYQWDRFNRWKDNGREDRTNGTAKSFRSTFPCMGKLRYIKNKRNTHTMPWLCACSFLPTHFCGKRHRCRSPPLQSDFGYYSQNSDWRHPKWVSITEKKGSNSKRKWKKMSESTA